MAAAGRRLIARQLRPAGPCRSSGSAPTRAASAVMPAAPVRCARPARLSYPGGPHGCHAHRPGAAGGRTWIPGCSTARRYPRRPRALADLRATVGGADLAAPPVVLPDFHHKSNMELPSSVAVATRASIRPTLTSASVNCGMALIAFDSARPDRAGIDEFYRRVRERFPYPPGTSTELSAAGCAPLRDGRRRRSRPTGSAPRTSILERVEEFGTLDLDRWDGADRLRRELPALVLQLARLRFGMVGPTNHFIELQEVEEVLRPGRRGEARRRTGPADPAVSRRRRRPAGGGRRDVRPQEALPEADPGGDVGGQAALPRHDRPLAGAAEAAVPAVLRRRLPAGCAGQRRGTPADARQRRRR